MNQNRSDLYQTTINQAKVLLEGESDAVANMANLSALLHQTFGFWWVGFYLIKEGELVLGPFQGPVACTRIKIGKGVCGTSAENQETLIVPNVHEFEGHIACSSESNSEIVVPMIRKGKVFGVLDIDSKSFDDFSEVDKEALELIVQNLIEKW